MTEADSFLKEIIAHPEDNLPRLVFADWLEERGEPRGEFIRIQCALAEMNEDVPEAVTLRSREASLLEKYRKTWTVGIRKFVRVYEFRRGFVERVTFNAKRNLSSIDKLFALAPIQEMKVRDLQDRVAEFAQGQFLERLVHLNLHACDLGPHRNEILLASPHLHHLQTLNLGNNDLGHRGVDALVRHETLPGLTSLNLSANDLLDAAIHRFAPSPLLRQLRSLELSMNRFGDAGVRSICRQAGLENLEGLGMVYCGISDEGVRMIAEYPYWKNLKSLRFCDSELGTDAMRSIAESPRMANLRSLMIGSFPIPRQGLRALGESPYLGKLDELILYGRGDDDVVDLLLEAPNFRRLRSLNVDAAVLGRNGKRRLKKRRVEAPSLKFPD